MAHLALIERVPTVIPSTKPNYLQTASTRLGPARTDATAALYPHPHTVPNHTTHFTEPFIMLCFVFVRDASFRQTHTAASEVHDPPDSGGSEGVARSSTTQGRDTHTTSVLARARADQHISACLSVAPVVFLPDMAQVIFIVAPFMPGSC